MYFTRGCHCCKKINVLNTRAMSPKWLPRWRSETCRTYFFLSRLDLITVLDVYHVEDEVEKLLILKSGSFSVFMYLMPLFNYEWNYIHHVYVAKQITCRSYGVTYHAFSNFFLLFRDKRKLYMLSRSKFNIEWFTEVFEYMFLRNCSARNVSCTNSSNDLITWPLHIVSI
jgi:hypothetical protein